MTQQRPLSKTEVINFLRKNKPYFLKHFGFTEIFLYGSYAKGTQHKNSDIDILIKIKKNKKTYQNLLAAEQFLQNNLHTKIELVFFDSLNPIIAFAIKKEVIKIE